MFLGSVHTSPGNFGNVVLFARLGLPSTINRHKNRVFRKRSSNRTNLKTSALRFSVDREHFENEAY